MSQWNNNNV